MTKVHAKISTTGLDKIQTLAGDKVTQHFLFLAGVDLILSNAVSSLADKAVVFILVLYDTYGHHIYVTTSIVST